MAFKIIESLAEVSAADWNAIVPNGAPLLEHEFLYGLEVCGCVGKNTGWQPAYCVYVADGQLTAALPSYIKYDSYGEYIFDWQWASAWQNAGLPYYPKLTVATPFSPVNTEKFLMHPRLNPDERDSIFKRMHSFLYDFGLKNKISGLHYLLSAPHEADSLEKEGMLRRISHQFHWYNRNTGSASALNQTPYESFEDWLTVLKSHRRKEIRRERKKIAEQGLTVEVLTGNDITPKNMQVMFQFYENTQNRNWGRAYLNYDFFQHLAKNFQNRILLLLAKHEDEYVAGTLNFYKDDRLYGRYWGASKFFDSLHFELSYYRNIEFAIEQKMSIFEAGAQGEHKFLRGFDAREIFSMHDFYHPRGKEAIAAFLKKERENEQHYIQELNERHTQNRQEAGPGNK